ncbi:hypothetical protein E2C01_040609 [Portunus trituberculatus]|uniref:Uncharacterized protein n=1 Tax=Portunus trituberculatus TaxID=210409 RepID=A0A5B7FNP6_PORTR|nr:hypothetical protein [Portunus trituberculatus]
MQSFLDRPLRQVFLASMPRHLASRREGKQKNDLLIWVSSLLDRGCAEGRPSRKLMLSRDGFRCPSLRVWLPQRGGAACRGLSSMDEGGVSKILWFSDQNIFNRQWNHACFGVRGVSKRTSSNLVHGPSVG